MASNIGMGDRRRWREGGGWKVDGDRIGREKRVQWNGRRTEEGKRVDDMD